MIQRHKPHPPGRFAKCPGCAAEPRHIIALGYSTHEQAISARRCLGERHRLECRCGHGTAWHQSLQAAEAEWGFLDSQVPLALPPAASVSHINDRRARRKAVRS